jgi:HEAT repeat protein
MRRKQKDRVQKTGASNKPLFKRQVEPNERIASAIARNADKLGPLGKVIRLTDTRGKGLSTLLENIKSASPLCRCTSIRLLIGYANSPRFNEMRDEIITSVAERLYDETNEGVRAEAGEFFSKVKDERAVIPLIHAAEDIGPFRDCAPYIRALANNPDLRAVSSLTFMLRATNGTGEIAEAAIKNILDKTQDITEFAKRFNKGADKLIRSFGTREYLPPEQKKALQRIRKSLKQKIDSA